MVSHELRTPITTILGNARILTERGASLDGDQRTQAMRDIRHEAERLNLVIDNLLTIARFERGMTVELEPVLVQRVIERAVAAARDGDPSCEVQLTLPPHLVTVEANALLVEQIVKNLLSNAAKFGGNEIDITAAPAGDSLVVTVEDHGVGVNPEEAEALFAPFYRSSRTANHAGIGVGLNVCRRLVEVMGGRIWAEPRDGGGARFAFSLPLASSDA